VVGRLVEDAEKRQRATRHKRDRSWDEKRSKATYDLPSKLKEEIRTVAEGEGVPAYEIVRLFLEYGLNEYREGGLRALGAKKKVRTRDFTLFPE